MRKTLKIEYPAVVRFSKTADADLGIQKSPRWNNLVGRDLGDAEIGNFAAENSADDNTAILVAAQFLNVLTTVPLDVKELRMCMVPWT